MPYLTHLTMRTGHARRSERAEVADDALAIVRPWMLNLVAAGSRQPLPVPDLSHFAAAATVQDGALLLTLFAPAGPHTQGKPAPADMPMITLGVAQRSRHAAVLWPLMVAQFGARDGLQPPGEPWCAVALHAGAAAYRGDIGWFGDFERCVAWAWITSRPDLRLAK